MQRLATQTTLRALRGATHHPLSGATPTLQRPLHRALLSTSTRQHSDVNTKTPPGTTATTKKPNAAVQTVSGNPELPKFSLDGLGLSKNMKVFLIVVLSIFGTMETWFYCKAIWRWWYGEEGLKVTTEEK